MNERPDQPHSSIKHGALRGRKDLAPEIGLRSIAQAVGTRLVDVFHNLALFAIGATIVWSAVVAFVGMVHKGSASVEDVLLLFIYLELGAMVGIYFKTNHMPVRFLMYVAMTSLTRMLISDAYLEHGQGIAIILVPSAILLLALGVLVVRLASAKYPSVPSAARIDDIGG